MGDVLVLEPALVLALISELRGWHGSHGDYIGHRAVELAEFEASDDKVENAKAISFILDIINPLFVDPTHQLWPAPTQDRISLHDVWKPK